MSVATGAFTAMRSDSGELDQWLNFARTWFLKSVHKFEADPTWRNLSCAQLARAGHHLIVSGRSSACWLEGLSRGLRCGLCESPLPFRACTG